MEVLAEKSARWALIGIFLLIVVYRQRATLNRYAFAREVVLVVAAYFSYFAVRGMTEGSQEQAFANAERLIALEMELGMFWEPAWQQRIVPYQFLVDLMNWIYIWAHWPLIIVVALWLYLRHPHTYRLFRNAFLISGGIGLVIFATYPVAPPRFMDVDMVDTITAHSRSYRLLQPPALVNQYAALPSLHFGWNMLIGIAIMTTIRQAWAKLLGPLITAAMFLAVVLTANHYIIDALAGALVAGFGLVAAAALMRFNESRGFARAYR